MTRFVKAALIASAGLFLTGCSAQQNAQLAKFCATDQPIVGVVATVAVTGAAVAYPAASPAVPIVGVVVQDVNGICAAIPGAVAVPAPPAGAKVLVPAKAP